MLKIRHMNKYGWYDEVYVMILPRKLEDYDQPAADFHSFQIRDGSLNF